VEISKNAGLSAHATIEAKGFAITPSEQKGVLMTVSPTQQKSYYKIVIK